MCDNQKYGTHLPLPGSNLRQKRELCSIDAEISQGTVLQGNTDCKEYLFIIHLFPEGFGTALQASVGASSHLQRYHHQYIHSAP